MYQIIDSRGAGKSSRLMLLAKENNGIVVCLDPINMRIKAHAYGITGLDLMSYYDFTQPETKFPPETPIYIDDVDMFLQYITYKTHGKLDGYTLSKEDKRLNEMH